MKQRLSDDPWQRVITELKQDHRIQFDRGLSDVEINGTEYRFGFRFPPDLRSFLQAGLPCDKQFPDWRNGSETQLRDWLDLPRKGILFDVQYNGFRLPEWGPKPSDLDKAFGLVNELISKAPKLIPIFLHRMMPDEPGRAGNPVFSVHQTDIIHSWMSLRSALGASASRRKANCQRSFAVNHC